MRPQACSIIGMICAMHLASSAIGFGKDRPSPLTKHPDCVAWQAKKTMFMMSDESPVGLNCQIRASMKSTADGHQVVIEIPIKGFNSKEEDRDDEVMKLLGAKQQPSLQFVSESLKKDQWLTLVHKGGQLSGVLNLAGKEFRLKFSVIAKEDRVWGQTNLKLSFFGIEPPSVGGGLVADVDDFISLQYHLRWPNIPGFPKS